MLDLSTLNEGQRKAVTFGEGPLLVLAGAGSGKTRVLVQRVAHLIGQGEDPESFFVSTFTKKAATEMKERLADIIGDVDKVQIGTFHSFCLRVLKVDGGNRFEIMRESEQKRLVKGLLEPPSKNYPDALNWRIDLGHVLSKLSLAKNNLLTVEDVEKRSDSSPIQANFVRLYRAYEKHKKALNKIDFDDMLLMCYQLFVECPEILAKYCERFKWVLVDELQDTNYAQWALIQMLSYPRNNITGVGDVDQAIYTWRGALPEQVLSFGQMFAGAATIILEENYRSTENVVDLANKLIANNSTRIRKRLIAMTGAGVDPFYTHCETPEDEAAFVAEEIEILLKGATDAKNQDTNGNTAGTLRGGQSIGNGSSSTPRLFEDDGGEALKRSGHTAEETGQSTGREQCQVAWGQIPDAERIHNEVGAEPPICGCEGLRLRTSPSDGEDTGSLFDARGGSSPQGSQQSEQRAGESAILQKSRGAHGASSGPEANEISRQTYRGRDIAILFRTNAQSRAFEDELVRRDIPYTIIGSAGFYNRKEIKDIISYLRVIHSTGDTEALERIINVPNRFLGKAYIQLIKTHSYRAGISVFEAMTETPGLKSFQFRAGDDFCYEIRSLQKMADNIPPVKLIYEVRKRFKYDDFLIKEEGGEDGADNNRIENLNELMSAANKFSSLSAFLDFIGKQQNKSSSDNKDPDKVQLMTIHCAKGLEWKIVFLVGVSQGLLPHKNAIEMGEDGNIIPESIEEERRLCYVGITRARQILYMSSINRWQNQYAEPSMFLHEVGVGFEELEAVSGGL